MDTSPGFCISYSFCMTVMSHHIMTSCHDITWRHDVKWHHIMMSHDVMTSNDVTPWCHMTSWRLRHTMMSHDVMMSNDVTPLCHIMVSNDVMMLYHVTYDVMTTHHRPRFHTWGHSSQKTWESRYFVILTFGLQPWPSWSDFIKVNPCPSHQISLSIKFLGFVMPLALRS